MPGRYNPMRRYVFRPAPRLESTPGYQGLAYRAREAEPDRVVGRSAQRSSSEVGIRQQRSVVEFGGLVGALESEALAQVDSSGAPDYRPVSSSYGSLWNTELSKGGLAEDEPSGRIEASARWRRN